jgi:hypothetical protein
MDVQPPPIGSPGMTEPGPDSAPPAAPESVPLSKPDHGQALGLARRLRRYGSALGRLLDERIGNGSIPYLFVCRVSSPEIGAIEIDDFPGLLSCHSIQDEQGQYVACSYWASRECFEINRQTFLQGLAGPAEVVGGRLSRSKVKAKNIAERFPVWTIVITISALVGAATALWEYGARLVEPPDITVAFKRGNLHDFENTEMPVVSFAVTNQCRFAPASVRIMRVMALVGSASPEMTAGGRISRVEPGKASEFDIEGSVLAPTPRPGRAEEYELRITVTAKAGLWRCERRFPFTSPRFRQWQPIGWTDPENFRVTAGACYLRGVLYSGRAQKVTASITAGLPIGLDSIVTSLRGQDFTDSKPSDSGRVRTQGFALGDMARFAEYPYTIRLSSRAMSEGACTQLAQMLAQHNNFTFQ